MILQLADERKLSLDAKLPEIPDEAVVGWLRHADGISIRYRNFIDLSPIFKEVEGKVIEGSPVLDTTLAAERIDAAAGVMSTLRDLLKFGRALFRGDLLSEQSRRFLMAAAEGMADLDEGESRVWAMQAARKPYGVIVYKGGDRPGGATAVLAFHPKSDAIFAAFVNSFGHFDESDFLLDVVCLSAVGAP